MIIISYTPYTDVAEVLTWWEGNANYSCMTSAQPCREYERTYLENNHCSGRSTIESTLRPLVGPFGFVAASVLRTMPRGRVIYDGETESFASCTLQPYIPGIYQALLKSNKDNLLVQLLLLLMYTPSCTMIEFMYRYTGTVQ